MQELTLLSTLHHELVNNMKDPHKYARVGKPVLQIGESGPTCAVVDTDQRVRSKWFSSINHLFNSDSGLVNSCAA